MSLIGRKPDPRETITHGILTLIPDRGASPVCKRSWRVEQSGVFMGSVERTGKRRWIEHAAGPYGSTAASACAWAVRVLNEREAAPTAPRAPRVRTPDASEHREQMAREAFIEAEEKREAREPLEPAKMKIVLAWTTEEQQVEREGSTWRLPTFKTVRVPRAAMWKNRGDAKDLAKARAYAAEQSSDRPHRVFTYPTSERDPLGRAKRDVVSR